MADDQIFQASGDACPICASLDGTVVSAGFTAHDNCACQTIPVGEDGECEHYFEGGVVTRYGSGPFDATYGYEVTVRCEDGAVMSMSAEFDMQGADGTADYGESMLTEAMEEAAEELCSQCQPPKPFLCC